MRPLYTEEFVSYK